MYMCILMHMKIGLIPLSAKPYHAGHHMLVQFAAGLRVTEAAKELALPENDAVGVFISYSGRGTKSVKDPSDTRPLSKGGRKIEVPTPGETPVFGADMKYIWTNILKPNLDLPGSVKLITPEDGALPAPVLNVHKVCEAFKAAVDAGKQTFRVPYLNITAPVEETVISIYSDSVDIVGNYPDEDMISRYGELWAGVGADCEAPCIQGVGIPRTATVEISGTKMRKMLCDGDIEGFSSLLPPLPDDVKRQIGTILSQSIAAGCPLERRGTKVHSEALLRALIRSIL